MQNIMRIARALSRRRKDGIALEVGDFVEALGYVDFVDRRSLDMLCRWLAHDAAQFPTVKAGGLALVAEGSGLLIPLSQEMRALMETLPISLEHIVGQPSEGSLDAQMMARWVLAEDLHRGDKLKKAVVSTVVQQAQAGPRSAETALSKPSLAECLKSVIYGQDDVLHSVIEAIADRESGGSRGPLTFFMVGPTASGKTLLANRLAESLPGYVCRSFEMSSYNSHNDFGLTGLRYGYADAHPGELTSFVRHHPRAIIIFENIDCAHPNIQNSLVPAISAGVLRDQYWAGLADRSASSGPWPAESGMFGLGKKDVPSGVANPDVSFAGCILVFTSSQGAAAYDLPLYNDRSKMRMEERSNMLLDSLRGSQESDRLLVSAMLNGLAESVVLPFCRLDTPALLLIAKRRLREAADRWRKQHQVGLRIEQFDMVAELFLLAQGGRASPRTLTLRMAENFLFSWFAQADHQALGGRVVFALDKDQIDAYKSVRQALGADPMRTLFRKQQALVCSPVSRPAAGGTRVEFTDFRLVTTQRAGDYSGLGGLQIEMPEVCFADVVGHTAGKARLRQIIRMLARKDELAALGVEVPHGMMLYGPPGTGKTMLAKAFSHEAECPFVAVTGTELMNPELIRTLFQRLRRYAPAVLFIDEIDALGKRGQSVLGDAVINQLLAEIDGFASGIEAPIFVIAATNYPEKLDPALLRSGRIDLHLEIPYLDEAARRAFLLRYRALPGLSEMDIERVLPATSDLSGADFEKIRRELVLAMARDGRSALDEQAVMASFTEFKHGVLRGAEFSHEEWARNAFHEAGHALVAQILIPEQVIERVSIEPRGATAGTVSFVSENWRPDHFAARRVMDYLTVLMAGRVAEMRQFGLSGCNAGAMSDLQKVTELATKAVVFWGLDDEFGQMALPGAGDRVPALTELPDWVVQRIRFWIDRSYADATRIVEQYWSAAVRIASLLLEVKTLDRQGWQALWAEIDPCAQPRLACV